MKSVMKENHFEEPNEDYAYDFENDKNVRGNKDFKVSEYIQPEEVKPQKINFEKALTKEDKIKNV